MKLIWKISLGIVLFLILLFSFAVYKESTINTKSEDVETASNVNNSYSEAEATYWNNMPTRWELLDIPFIHFAYGNVYVQFEEYTPVAKVPCTEDIIIVDKYKTYQYPTSCNNDNQIIVLVPKGYMAQLDRAGQAPLKLIASYNFDKYGLKYNWTEFEI